MRICIIHQYYKTPSTGGAIRSYYIAHYLKGLGHDVVIITARNNRAYSVDSKEGFDVHSLPIYYENHLSFMSRIHAFFLFAWKAYRLLKKLPKPDLNYVITTPLTTGIVAKRAKAKLNIPYIFEVGDLWPDAPIQLGVLKNGLLKKLAFHWEKSFYRDAAQIIALSPDIKREISRKVPEKNVEVITNMADSKLIRNSTKNPELEAKYNSSGYFLVSYLGTVGVANHLEYLCQVAKSTKHEKIKFLVVGSGARFDAIKALAEKYKLQNIDFYAHRSKHELNEIINVTDAMFISFKNVPVLSTGSPNKFFDGLASGKLLIVNFKGWIKDLIEENQCGFYYDPDHPTKFIEKLGPYLESQELLKKAKKNAFDLASDFTPEAQLKSLSTMLNQIVKT